MDMATSLASIPLLSNVCAASVFAGVITGRRPPTFPLRLAASRPALASLQDQFPLHFRHSGKDVEEKASSGSFGVDTVSERTKIDLPRIKFGSKVNQPFH